MDEQDVMWCMWWWMNEWMAFDGMTKKNFKKGWGWQ